MPRLRFIERTRAGGWHPTSGLPGFPARDYMARGWSVVRAPFTGRVPWTRPIGWSATQNPSAGFGGQRVYLERASTGDQAYCAHFGKLNVRRGSKFNQGDVIGWVWDWPRDPGRSHIHVGYQGGDPLFTIIRSDGSLIINEVDPKLPGPPYVTPPYALPVLVHTQFGWAVKRDGKYLRKWGKKFFKSRDKAYKLYVEKKGYWLRKNERRK